MLLIILTFVRLFATDAIVYSSEFVFTYSLFDGFSSIICLNALFHKAYDNYLIAITPDYSIIISDEMIVKTEEEPFKVYLIGLQNKKLMLPDRFYPKKEFLDYHYQKYLNG